MFPFVGAVQFACDSRTLIDAGVKKASLIFFDASTPSDLALNSGLHLTSKYRISFNGLLL